MSKITDFFINGSVDHKGRTHAELVAMDNKEFEACHDHIQWLFPLHEKSYHAKSDEVPILTAEDIEVLVDSISARYNMDLGHQRFVAFLGSQFKSSFTAPLWCHDRNHNLLRITREIRSLRLFGLKSNAIGLHKFVSDVGQKFNLDLKTFEYWDAALNDDVMASMTARFLKEREIKI